MRERRLGLQAVLSKTKPPVLQFLPGQGWRVWTAYNFNLSAGTYISLGDTGLMERVTIAPDGSISYSTL